MFLRTWSCACNVSTVISNLSAPNTGRLFAPYPRATAILSLSCWILTACISAASSGELLSAPRSSQAEMMEELEFIHSNLRRVNDVLC